MLIDFRERREMGEKEREKEKERVTLLWQRSIHRLPPLCTLTGMQTHNLGMWPDRELNLQPFGVQDNASTSWASPGRALVLILKLCLLPTLLDLVLNRLFMSREENFHISISGCFCNLEFSILSLISGLRNMVLHHTLWAPINYIFRHKETPLYWGGTLQQRSGMSQADHDTCQNRCMPIVGQ